MFDVYFQSNVGLFDQGTDFNRIRSLIVVYGPVVFWLPLSGEISPNTASPSGDGPILERLFESSVPSDCLC
jgi:hypothetical protein